MAEKLGRMGKRWEEMVEVASFEVNLVMKTLPATVRETANAVPVVFERKPRKHLIKEGIAPDTMGLFEGSSCMDPEGATAELPSQITLFLDNIWDEADADTARFREEVRITLLHELGHYLGYDELDLAERDLE